MGSSCCLHLASKGTLSLRDPRRAAAPSTFPCIELCLLLQNG